MEDIFVKEEENEKKYLYIGNVLLYFVFYIVIIGLNSKFMLCV